PVRPPTAYWLVPCLWAFLPSYSHTQSLPPDTTPQAIARSASSNSRERLQKQPGRIAVRNIVASGDPAPDKQTLLLLALVTGRRRRDRLFHWKLRHVRLTGTVLVLLCRRLGRWNCGNRRLRGRSLRNCRLCRRQCCRRILGQRGLCRGILLRDGRLSARRG